MKCDRNVLNVIRICDIPVDVTLSRCIENTRHVIISFIDIYAFMSRACRSPSTFEFKLLSPLEVYLNQLNLVKPISLYLTFYAHGQCPRVR